jgi:hypothetical protein
MFARPTEDERTAGGAELGEKMRERHADGCGDPYGRRCTGEDAIRAATWKTEILHQERVLQKSIASYGRRPVVELEAPYEEE